MGDGGRADSRLVGKGRAPEALNQRAGKAAYDTKSGERTFDNLAKGQRIWS